MFIPEFYKEMLKYFAEMSNQRQCRGVLWNNKELGIGNQSLFKPDWFEKGIMYVRDIIGVNGRILPVNELKRRFSLDSVEPLFYNGLKLKLNNWLKTSENNQTLEINYTVDFKSTLYRIGNSVINVKKAKSKDYYNILIQEKIKSPTSIKSWEGMGLLDAHCLNKSLEVYRKCTKETSLIAMQLKIIHNIIATNKRKYDWKIQNNSECQYCSSLDTIIHYFWFCPFTQQVIKKCLDSLVIKNFRFNIWEFIFGKDELKTDNLSILIKYYIYQLRKENKEFNKKEFLTEVKLRWIIDKTEEHVYQNKYQDKWKYFENIENEILDDFVKFY